MSETDAAFEYGYTAGWYRGASFALCIVAVIVAVVVVARWWFGW